VIVASVHDLLPTGCGGTALRIGTSGANEGRSSGMDVASRSRCSSRYGTLPPDWSYADPSCCSATTSLVESRRLFTCRQRSRRKTVTLKRCSARRTPVVLLSLECIPRKGNHKRSQHRHCHYLTQPGSDGRALGSFVIDAL